MIKRIALHKIGVGGVYESQDKRATAVQTTRWSKTGIGHSTPYYVWVARLDGEKLGEGSLSHCRKLINAPRSKTAPALEALDRIARFIFKHKETNLGADCVRIRHVLSEMQ